MAGIAAGKLAGNQAQTSQMDHLLATGSDGRVTLGFVRK